MIVVPSLLRAATFLQVRGRGRRCNPPSGGSRGVRDGVLPEVGEVRADERVDGVEPGGSVLVDAGAGPVGDPFADGGVGFGCPRWSRCVRRPG